MPESRQALRAKLQQKLRDLFQFDVSDLDFGIYRILNHRKDEIEQFIEKDLLAAIQEGLKEYLKEDESQLDELKQQIVTNFGNDAFDSEGNLVQYQDTPLGKNYLKALEKARKQEVSEEIEKRIYQDLYTFFSRYYDEGDFLTQRRISTRDAKYAIPYNGEEVMLHWANKDQYYIKTGEHFTDYKFEADGLDVWFKLQQARTEKDNVKESDSRYFVLRPNNPIEIDEAQDTLTLWFEYRSFEGGEEEKWLEYYNQDKSKSNKRASLTAQNGRKAQCEAYAAFLLNELKPNFRNKLVKLEGNNHSKIYNKLNHYTARNTTDYFIHKNLQQFLERELEYYLKHEVIRVDDFIAADSEQPLQTALTRAKVERTIGEKIIAFLSQIEDFQKKLFEKKKFVVDTQYCFTLDKLPKKLYKAILENEAQLEYWKDCYATHEWAANLEWNTEWSEAVLKNHPFLMIDTCFFDDDFKYELLASFDNLEEELGGLLINSENFQALNFIKNKYIQKVNCIYIDPPYNTVHSEILYKNQFKHSSWLSLIDNTVPLGKNILNENASYGFAIDDYEFPNLIGYLNDQFSEWDISPIVVNHHPQGAGGRVSRTHEYYIICTKKDSEDLKGKVKVDYIEDRAFMRAGRAINNYREGRWKSFYALLYEPYSGNVIDIEDPPPLGENYPIEEINGLKRVYPINSKGEERVWRSSYKTGRRRAKNGELFVSDSGTVYQKINHKDKREILFSNWTDSKYNSGPHGTGVLEKLGLENDFDYPKSIFTMETGIIAQTFAKTDAIVLDYFAGSGTTGHAVLNLNKEDDGNRKYILIEMGKYFDTVLKPRLQKVVFSNNWKNGVPQDKNGQSHAFKYHFIESYEDTLNNICFKNKDQTQHAFDFDDFLLKYMLDFGTRGASPSLLKNEAFETPFDYQLKIQRGHESPAKEKVDLIETFHYLIGLWVKTLHRHEHQNRKYVISQGEIRSEDAIENVLVIWRNTKDLNIDEEAGWINDDIIEDQIFDRIYVNGANKIKDAQPIEIAFREKMFG